MSTDFPWPAYETSPAERVPAAYRRFREHYPELAVTLDEVTAAVDRAGPLTAHAQRLIKLGIAVGAVSDDAVRHNARHALAAGATPDELRHVALLALTTVGLPTTVAALATLDEVLLDAASDAAT
jgi:alkylhydroperoxidase/carboxymuconolactone decarboxylase family protein YurZ